MGAVAGAPLGVHLGNAARGNTLLTLGAGVGAGAVTLGALVGESDYRFFLPVSGAVAIRRRRRSTHDAVRSRVAATRGPLRIAR